MSAFERFDLAGRDVTPRELARRWRQFHRDVRRTSSSRMARLIGPLVGDDTRRRRLLEKVRPRANPAAPIDAAHVRAFPTNFMPTAPPQPRDDLDASVELITLSSDDPTELFEKFQSALASKKEWLLVTRDLDHTGRATARLLSDYGAGVDVVFADEIGDTPTLPILKPATVGPHTLLSYNLVGRPALLRRASVARVGGVRADAGRAAEHDLYLRLLEAQSTWRHVPVVLPGREPAARQHIQLGPDTQRVVAEALARRGVSAEVSLSTRPSLVTWRPVPKVWPSIDVIIPTRDRVDLLRECVASVEASTYSDFSITILNNDSVDPTTLEYFAATPHRVIDCPGPFNYAAIINRGVAHSSSDYVVTLNNDTVVRSDDWLQQLVGVAALGDVSVVGATLLDRHDVHEHDGIVIAPYPQHLRRGVNYLVEDEWVQARRDVAAVTGAVQMIARAQYLALGGMDERLAVVMNDVDLCLRSQTDGRYVVMVPDVVLSHFAGSSRGRLDPLDDRNRFVQRWDVFGTLRDPYFAESLRLLGHTIEYRTPVPD